MEIEQNLNNQNKNQYFWNFAFMVFYTVFMVSVIYLFVKLNRLPAKISIFDFILLILATFRLTHLFVYDHITGFIRNYFGKFELGPGKTIATLLFCPWCTGIWASFFLGAIYFFNSLCLVFHISTGIGGGRHFF